MSFTSIEPAVSRLHRSELAVPIISTQLVTDALIGERESLENLIGATFVFGADGVDVGVTFGDTRQA